MNEQSSNVVTQFFAWLAAIASAAGITTQDIGFIAFGFIGVAVSIISLVASRIDARRKLRQEAERTEIMRQFYSRADPDNPSATAQMLSDVVSHERGN
ncbi:hypothetical protein FOT80_12435 [Serratia fonticola]|nr:hypothetical protein [Serratia fonticola]